MKRIIRLSLLMMLIPLFIQNVYAEESSIDNDSTKKSIEVVDKKTTMEEMINDLPEEYSLNKEEEDCFRTEEENEQSNAEIALREEIEKTWTENEIDTESFDISVQKTLENDSIYSYRVLVKDKETEEEIEKTIHVNYSNTKEEVEDVDILPEEEVKVILYYDLFTSQELENQVSLEEYLESIFEDDSITYYPDVTDWNMTFFTFEYQGKIYIFQDGVFYKALPIAEEYVPKISITEDVGESYVLQVAEKRYSEITEETLPKNDFYFKENHTVYSKSTDTNYGRIEIEYLKEEEKVNYEYIEGANSTVSKNSPSLSVRVNGQSEKMVKVLINNVEVNSNYYTVNEEPSKITFDENFLKSMSAGTYNLVVKYFDGDAKTTFTLIEEKRVELPTRIYTSYTPVRVTQTTEEEQEKEPEEVEVKEETKELLLEESKEVSKDNKKDNSKKNTKVEQPKKEEIKNFIFIPIIIIVVAIAVGGLGFILYKKSQEE